MYIFSFKKSRAVLPDPKKAVLASTVQEEDTDRQNNLAQKAGHF